MIDSIYLIKYRAWWDGSPWIILDNCIRGMYIVDKTVTIHSFPMREGPPGKSVAIPMKIERI